MGRFLELANVKTAVKPEDLEADLSAAAGEIARDPDVESVFFVVALLRRYVPADGIPKCTVAELKTMLELGSRVDGFLEPRDTDPNDETRTISRELRFFLNRTLAWVVDKVRERVADPDRSLAQLNFTARRKACDAGLGAGTQNAGLANDLSSLAGLLKLFGREPEHVIADALGIQFAAKEDRYRERVRDFLRAVFEDAKNTDIVRRDAAAALAFVEADNGDLPSAREWLAKAREARSDPLPAPFLERLSLKYVELRIEDRDAGLRPRTFH